MTIIHKNQEWQVIKIYPYFYLCRSRLGFRECFLKTEIDGIPKLILKKQEELYKGAMDDRIK